jgi:hypothetical protein
MSIVTVTERSRTGITYSVLAGGKRLWTRTVLFGMTRAQRAGGQAFVLAAREQEHVARGALEGQARGAAPVHKPVDRQQVVAPQYRQRVARP